MSSDDRDAGDLFRGIPSRSSQSFIALCEFCHRHAASVEASLPWLAAEVSRNDGHAAMLDLVQRWSGMRLYVASQHRRFSERVGCGLGRATYLRLVEQVGAGFQVEVPSAWGVYLTLRRVAIDEALQAGTPKGQIASRFGVTMRSLR